MSEAVAPAKRRKPPRRRPVDPTEGPWLIRSHYWGRWHRRSAEGGACGYTDDIAQAGVFGLDKAASYHDWQAPNGRDEAIPTKRYAKQMAARLREMEAERDAFAAKLATLKAATESPASDPTGHERNP